MWTGEEVCAREFSPGHLARVAGQLRRKPFLWDNYPVNDGARMSQHLHLRAFTGRPASIAPHIAGHGINPASQPVLSRIPALTLAESYRAGDFYEYRRRLRPRRARGSGRGRWPRAWPGPADAPGSRPRPARRAPRRAARPLRWLRSSRRARNPGLAGRKLGRHRRTGANAIITESAIIRLALQLTNATELACGCAQASRRSSAGPGPEPQADSYRLEKAFSNRSQASGDTALAEVAASAICPATRACAVGAGNIDRRRSA